MTESIALYKIPKSLDVARILDDSVLDACNESIKSYNNERARETLGRFSKDKGELTGSSPFMFVHLANSRLLPNGARLATRKDLEIAISLDNNFLRENYTDFGLALRTAGDSYTPNDLLTKRLAKQLKEIEIKLNKGKLIYFGALKLEEAQDSGYGLVFDLTEQAKDLRKDFIVDLDNFKWNYSGTKGLARAYLGRGRDWYSDGEHLAGSDGGGRVVVVSGEATSQKILDEYLTKLAQERANRDAQLTTRFNSAKQVIADAYKQAEAILRGE